MTNTTSSTNVPSYKLLDLINSFDAIVEKYGDGDIGLEDARAQLTAIREQANQAGFTLPEIDNVLSKSGSTFSQVHIALQDIVDRFVAGRLNEKAATDEITKLEALANAQGIPLIGGLNLVKTLAGRLAAEKKDKKSEQFDDYSEEEWSSSETYDDGDY